MITQIAVGNTIAPAIIYVKILTVGRAVPLITNKIITTINKTRNGIVFTRLTNPLLPSASHLLLYVVITVQAVGIAITLKITAIQRSIDFKVPELIIAPIHTSAVIKINGIAKFFMEAIEFSYFSTVVSRSL